MEKETRREKTMAQHRSMGNHDSFAMVIKVRFNAQLVLLVLISRFLVGWWRLFTQFAPCTNPLSHGAKHDPSFQAGAVRIGAARRRATATEASLCGDGRLATELRAAEHGGPLSRTQKEAGAETYTSSTSQRRPCVANVR